MNCNNCSICLRYNIRSKHFARDCPRLMTNICLVCKTLGHTPRHCPLRNYKQLPNTIRQRGPEYDNNYKLFPILGDIPTSHDLLTSWRYTIQQTYSGLR